MSTDERTLTHMRSCRRTTCPIAAAICNGVRMSLSLYDMLTVDGTACANTSIVLCTSLRATASNSCCNSKQANAVAACSHNVTQSLLTAGLLKFNSQLSVAFTVPTESLKLQRPECIQELHPDPGLSSKF
jgi:hypothetical protein